MAEIKKVSVIGLGLMGTPLASFLTKAGYRVTGFDIIKKQMSNLLPLGLRAARSPQEAARGADLIMLSLPTWNAVVQVVDGKDGVMKSLRQGQIIMDTGTSPPWESRAMGEKLAGKGVEWMDVPISGSSAQARVGNMVFMVGGKKTIFEKVKPILDQIGKKTVYAGKSGNGASLKLAVNLTLYLNQAAAIEGLVLGLKAGLDPDILFDVMTSGAASSNLIVARGKDMLRGNFAPKGPTGIANKDMALILETAKKLGVVLPVGGLYQQLMLKALYNGWGLLDATVVMKIYEQLAEGAGEKKKPVRKRK